MLRVPVEKLEPGELVLDGPTARYVVGVRRVGPGDRIVLFDPERACEAVAEVIEASKKGVVCRAGPIAAARRTMRSIVLVQGIPKGEKFDAVIRDATELGATLVVAVETARTVVRMGGRAKGRLERWRRIAREASRQSGRVSAPELAGPLPWERGLSLAPNDALKLCLWEDATDPLGPELARLGSAQPVAIAVGPEGGLEVKEVEAARTAGYRAVSLGPIVLRTETVASAVLGAVLVQTQLAPAPEVPCGS